MARFIVVPQWQGSPAARAMLLVDGADAIAGDLPRSACERIDVPLEAGESLGTGVQRLSTLVRTREMIALALEAHVDSVVVVGGDCGVAVPAIGHAAALHPGMAVVWLDAHGDLHSPDSSPSGAFSGMALRAALGEGEPSLTLTPGAIGPDRLIVAGARDLDDAEAEYLAASPAVHLSATDLSNPDALADAVAATGADAVYIHVDLDVLDPATMTGLALPVPFGVTAPDLVAAIGRLRARVRLVGASVSGFAPATPTAAVEDLGTILRVIGAVA